MNKYGLVEIVSRETGPSEKKAVEAVNTILSEISNALANCEIGN